MGDLPTALNPFAAPGQETVTHAEYRLTGKECYLRTECTDAEGRTA